MWCVSEIESKFNDLTCLDSSTKCNFQGKKFIFAEYLTMLVFLQNRECQVITIVNTCNRHWKPEKANFVLILAPCIKQKVTMVTNLEINYLDSTYTC